MLDEETLYSCRHIRPSGGVPCSEASQSALETGTPTGFAQFTSFASFAISGLPPHHATAAGETETETPGLEIPHRASVEQVSKFQAGVLCIPTLLYPFEVFPYIRLSPFAVTLTTSLLYRSLLPQSHRNTTNPVLTPHIPYSTSRPRLHITLTTRANTSKNGRRTTPVQIQRHDDLRWLLGRRGTGLEET